MFTNLSTENIKTLFDLYKSGDYNIFFRHYEEFLNYVQFTQIIESFKWLCFDEGVVMLQIQTKPRICLVSVLVYKEHQGKGIGLKAMLSLAKYLFENGILRIVVHTLEEDEHTNKICEKGGFEKEGLLVNSCKMEQLHNEIRWGISKEKYLEIYGGSYE